MKQKLFIFFILFIPVVSSFSQPLSLVYPKNDFVTDTTHIRFEWNGIAGAINYNLEIASDSLFTSIVSNHSGITNTFYLDTLNLNQIIWWRVQSFDGTSLSPWSSQNKLNIINPTFFSGLDIWYSSDTGVVLNGTTVSTWQDLSGNNNHAKQTDPIKQPTKIPNVLNGKPVLRFDGTNDFMEFSKLTNIRTAFIITKHATGNSPGPEILIGDSMWYDWHGSTGTKLFEPSNASINIRSGKSYLNGLAMVPVNLLKPTSYSILSFITTANVRGQYITNDRSYASDRYWNGDFAEIIFYNDTLSFINKTLIEKYLDYKYAGNPVNLGVDVHGICDTTLDAGSGFKNYHWSTGETTQTIQINNNGFYSVTVTDIFDYKSSDSIFVNKQIMTLHDTSFCENDSVTISAGLGNSYFYHWSTGDTTESITVHTGGLYSLTVRDSLGCPVSKTVNVIEDMFATTTTLGPDGTICSGDTLRLAIGGAAATSYIWSGGSTNNFLVVDTAGSYSVTVTNAVGCLAMDTINLTIKGLLPAPDFFYDSVCVGNATQFLDASTIPTGQIVDRLWSFDDPGSGISNSSTSLNPLHPFTHAGIFNVQLATTSDSGCVKTIIKPVTVFSLPVVNFSPTNGCNGLAIQFTDKSTNAYGAITGWSWDFGDATPNSTAANPVHTYDTAGTYQVILVITTEAGCSKSRTKTITIRKSPAVGFTFTSSCIGNTVYFTDTTHAYPWNEILNWYWNFGGGHTNSTPNPSIVFDSAGIYPVTLTITSLNGCVISVTKQDTVHAIPLVDFTYADICAGQPYQFHDNSTVQNDTISHWQWEFGNLGSSTLKNPTFVFPNTGSYIINLAVSTNAGCMDSTMRNAVVNAVPTAEFSFDYPYGIAPLNENFTDLSTGGASYLWTFGDSTPNSTLENPSHLFLENGIYTVTLITTNQYGCSDTTTHEIQIIPSSVDIVVTKVYASIDGGYLKLGADLMNNGTRRISEINMDSHVDGGFDYRENWKGLLDPGTVMHYDFTTQLAVSPSKPPEYVCVEAVLLAAEHETNLSNNELCYAFTTEFTCLDPYPDPAGNLLNIYFILPFDDNVEILLYDSKGSQLKSIYSGAAMEGINHITLDVTGLSKGIYAYKINFRDKSFVKKFMKD